MGKNIKVVGIGHETSNENEESKGGEVVSVEVVDKVDDVAEVVNEAVEEVVLEATEPETARVDNTPKKREK